MRGQRSSCSCRLSRDETRAYQAECVNGVGRTQHAPCAENILASSGEKLPVCNWKCFTNAIYAKPADDILRRVVRLAEFRSVGDVIALKNARGARPDLRAGAGNVYRPLLPGDGKARGCQ